MTKIDLHCKLCGTDLNYSQFRLREAVKRWAKATRAYCPAKHYEGLADFAKAEDKLLELAKELEAQG